MKKTILRTMLCAIPAAALVACGGSEESPVDARQSPLAGKPSSGSTQTAQSIMIDASGVPTTLAVVSTEQYKYDPTAAAALFSNAWDGVVPVPTSDKKTSTTNGTKTSGTAPPDEPACEPAVPDMPATPAALVTKLIKDLNPGQNDVVGQNKCNFLDGATLAGSSYTQSATSQTTQCTYTTYQQQGGNYTPKANVVTRTDTYSFNYVIAPLQPSYPVFTAWPLDRILGGGGNASVDITALIAGESVSVSNNLNTKYSFSLLQNDGITPRVSNVGVSVDGGAVDYTGISTYVDRASEPSLDYLYNANALTCNGTACGSLVNGYKALNILNDFDAFKGNDNGGTNGQALAAVRFGGVSVSLAPSTTAYNIAISATVKDNAGTAIGQLSVAKQVNVVTPGCSRN